jgi:uncharacterized protein YqgC (DUF456 family)
MENKKYPALNTIANFYRFFAWFTGILTIFLMIVGIIAAVTSQTYIGGGIFGFLGSVLGAVFGSIVAVFIYGAVGFIIATLQLAVAEVLDVFMDIEANTRK